MPTLVMEANVACPPALAVERIYHYFGAHSPHQTTWRLRVPFEDLGLPNVGELARDVLLTLEEVEQKGRIARIPISWRVPESNAFPVFQGFFEVRPLTDIETNVSILGFYHPPFGVVGAAFDAVAGRKIATATLRHLLAEVVRAVAA